MRPTVYGKEIIFDTRGSLLGINLGFNFYCEHEGGTQGLVKGVNEHAYPDGITLSQYRKLERAAEKAIKKWAKSPVAGHVFVPSTQTFTRKIIVDNSTVDEKFASRQLRNGKYVLFSCCGAVYSAPTYWSKRLGTSRKFSEAELLYMPDYNPSMRYFGNDDFAASWASDGFMLLLREDAPFPVEGVIKDLCEALTRNTLACLPQHPAFNSHGCTLVILDRMSEVINPLEVRDYIYQ